MDTITLSGLKKELSLLPTKDVVEICMKLARYKKENKELLHYLLHYEHNEHDYIETVKKEITFFFNESTYFTTVLTKKKIRKILNITNKFIKYSKHKQTEVELRIHFCTEIKKTDNLKYADKSLLNLYQRQLLKINKALEKLHEDLQHDYLEEIKSLV